MSIKLGLRVTALSAVVACSAIGQIVLAGTAGAVTTTKGELNNGQLRLEGQSSPGVYVMATSTTSVAASRANPNGQFKIQAANFTAPDCIVTVADGQTATATVTLAGCTPSALPVPPTPAPPTGTCIITAPAPSTLTAGTPTAVNFDTTGCNTTFNSGATPTPVQWTIIAGAIPTGMTGPNFQGTTAGNIIGTPSIPGTYQFTLRVTDQIGATDQANVTITVV